MKNNNFFSFRKSLLFNSQLMGPGRSEFAKHATMTVLALVENYACTQYKNDESGCFISFLQTLDF